VDTVADGDDRWVVLGRVSGLYGVRGWFRVHSETRPREGILDYSPWFLGRGGRWEERRLAAGRPLGKGVVASLEGCEDRDQAALLVGAPIAVRRSQLGAAAPGEYYWADLEGLEVRTVDGVLLGRIDHLLETVSNDVMVVRGDRERLLPFLRGQVVKRVDLAGGVVEVDWDPEF
jgi:16S rRNA processing protein RimM